MQSSHEAIHYRAAHEVAAELSEGQTTSKNLVEALLSRIQSYDSELGAYAAVYTDDARKMAESADLARQLGYTTSPLHGIPVAVKDIIDIGGRVTTGGSKVWAKRVSPATAPLVSRLIKAGMIVIGKTHSVEFALGSFGTNQHLGTPKNPWDRRFYRAPGGSSSGTGVAVASGMAPWGIGTDTGGSIRIPSSWCGLTGLKTTIGRISTEGVLPLSHTLDTPGPMSRCVKDAALLYKVLAHTDSVGLPHRLESQEDPLQELERGVSGLILARAPDKEMDIVDPQVLAAYEDSMRVLEQLGAKLIDVSLPVDFAEIGMLTGRIMSAEGYSYVGEFIDDPTLPLDQDVRIRFKAGKDVLARDYLKLLRNQQQIKRAYERALSGTDALLTPTTATPAQIVEDIDQSGTAAGFTRPFNLIERCALALPNGFTSEGLPTSLQIGCAPYREALALRIGYAYEQATTWHLTHPAI